MIITYIVGESSNTLIPICKIIRHLTLIVMWENIILDPACVSLSLPVNSKPAK